jgi:hypothetical protein
MGRAEVLQEIRRMRFEALLERHERGELNQIEAAEMRASSAASATSIAVSSSGPPVLLLATASGAAFGMM